MRPPETSELDVSGDDAVTPLDAVLVANAVTRNVDSADAPSTARRFDINGDGSNSRSRVIAVEVSRMAGASVLESRSR